MAQSGKAGIEEHTGGTIVFTMLLSINGQKLMVGTGSPAGACAAAQGSIFIRTDGGAGATLYVKETGGATNAGWTAK